MIIDRWDINPFCGAGPVAFGLTRAEVRRLLGNHASTFRKGPYATSETDAYKNLGAHFEFDENDKLESIELFGPVPVYYKDIAIVRLPVDQVLKSLTDAGLTYREDDCYFFDDAGFALYAPMDLVEAVTVYRKGYYDEVC